MTPKNWIKDKLEENNLDTTPVYKLYKKYEEMFDTGIGQDSYKRKVRKCRQELDLDTFDVDYISDEQKDDYLIRQQAQRQKLLDVNNHERKLNRENFRLHNSLEELFEEYINKLSEVKLNSFKLKEYKSHKKSKVGIIQISDTHFNELIESTDLTCDNYYDFFVASKRLKKLADRSIEEFKNKNIKDCYIFLTGDLVNSTRRLSEQLAQCTSLVSASILATHLLVQFITYINVVGKCNVKVSHVVGNESRLDDFMDHSDMLASNNWDFLIFNNLKIIFENNNKQKGIKFIKPTHLAENLVQMENGFNVLLVHGHNLRGKEQDAVRKLISKYALKGIKIHMVLYGHYHNSSIGDLVSRCGSLCGANSFSDLNLNFMTRASQNIYFVDIEEMCYEGLKIDLHNTDKYKGFDIIEKLEEYNVRNTKETLQIISKALI